MRNAVKYQIGHTLRQRAKGQDHSYTLSGTFQTVNRHGFDAKVLVWTGNCATCGCSFEATPDQHPDAGLVV
jgi:hypothetical protein